MQSSFKDLFIALVCFGILGVYVYKQIDWNPPKSERIYAVEFDGKRIPLKEVHVIEIPQNVYEGMDENPKWKEYLLGDKKRIVLFTWDGCPYVRAYREELDKAFGVSGLSKNYTKDIIVTQKEISAWCSFDEKNYHGQSCPASWLVENCVGGVCIINPKTKEAIADFSQNAKQFVSLLMYYANWDDNSLFAS